MMTYEVKEVLMKENKKVKNPIDTIECTSYMFIPYLSLNIP